MTHDMAKRFALREHDHYAIHRRHLNEQMVRVLKAIGYDVGFCSGKGQYLYDRDGNRYLDLLSGFGVFAIGRNHPALCEALKSVLDSAGSHQANVPIILSRQCTKRFAFSRANF